MNKDIKNQTDEEIIQSVLNGDKEMYGLLVNRYQRMVLGYGYQLCRNQDTASDLAQETFITAYNSLDRLKEPAAFPGWLLGILKNKYRNLERVNKIPTISLSELGLDFPDSDQRPMYSEEQLEKISHYVSSLPEKYREVVLLKYLQDFSYKEIARILDIPVTTVTMRLIYARKFLMKKAKEDGLL
jgi:RNA polymerase sigma-70 factor, ECF subfamily